MVEDTFGGDNSKDIIGGNFTSLSKAERLVKKRENE